MKKLICIVLAALMLMGNCYAFNDTDGHIFVNPGSVSIPKENSPHSYMTYENGTFLWKDVETGEVYKEYKI